MLLIDYTTSKESEVMSIFWKIVLLAYLTASIDGRIFKRHPSSYLAQNKMSSSPDVPLLSKEWVNVQTTSEQIVKSPVGSKVELECEVIGTPPPRSEWFFEESSLFQVGFEEQNVVINTAIGKIKSRLVLDCVLPRYQGSYTCSGISGAKTETTSPITLLVQGKNISEHSSNCDEKANRKPRIIMWSTTLLELVGNDVVLPCAAIGNPKPDIYWMNNNNHVIYPDGESSHFKVLPNGDLLISKITWEEDMGMFACVAQNALGEDKVETFLYPVKRE